MPDDYLLPAEDIRRELTVSNSRFIATLAPIFSVNEAKAFVALIHKEFGNATHNVPAYIIGEGNSITEYCSDDGEPSGTAGRPALAVPCARRIPVHIVTLVLPYPLLERICLLVTRHNGEIIDENFTGDVAMTLRFLVNEIDTFRMLCVNCQREVCEEK